MARSPEHDALMDELANDGWNITKTGGGHFKAQRKGWDPVFLASTPSDPRAEANTLSLVRRIYRENGLAIPRDRQPLKPKVAAPTRSEARVSKALVEDYNKACAERDKLAAENEFLKQTVKTIEEYAEDLRKAKVDVPMTDLERALLAPHMPLIEWARGQQAQMEQVKKDICTLDRAMRTLRDNGNAEPRDTSVLEPKPKTPVHAKPKDRHATKHGEEFRLKQMLLHDKKAGPPRKGMIWQPRGTGGQWIKPTPRYCWHCGKEVKGDYFCSIDHAKKYLSKHKRDTPMRVYRTRANMTFAEAGAQGKEESDG